MVCAAKTIHGDMESHRGIGGVTLIVHGGHNWSWKAMKKTSELRPARQGVTCQRKVRAVFQADGIATAEA